MDARRIVSALDKAITKVGSELLDAAMANPPYSVMPPSAQRRSILESSDDLRTALGNLRMPNYNDDVTVAAYLFYYQASHIGLAWAMINEMVRRQPESRLLTAGSNHLQVVDFGCGALAMQFGVALAVAEAMKNGEEVEAISIDGIDTSSKMQDAGRALWREFVDVVSKDNDLGNLSRVCQLITFNQHRDYRSVQKVDGAECWISAMHAVYQSNAVEVRQAFNHLHQNFEPTAVLATCWGRENMTTNTDIVSGAWPCVPDEFDYDIIYLPTNQQYNIQYPFNNIEPAARNMNRAAYEHGIIPRSWNLFWRVADAVILTWTLTEAGRELRGERHREPAEQERREARRQRDRERRQRRREEEARQREEQERQRRRQEEARRHSDRVEHQQQHGEAQRHSGRGIPGKILSGLSLLFRRRRK